MYQVTSSPDRRPPRACARPAAQSMERKNGRVKGPFAPTPGLEIREFEALHFGFLMRLEAALFLFELYRIM
jgi:hypothetical protein